MQYVERVRLYAENMKLSEAAEREFGREQGIEQGKNSIRLLIQRMTEAGDTNLLANLADEAFMKQMYEKYRL